MSNLAWLLASLISWPRDTVYLHWPGFLSVSCRISPYTEFPTCEGSQHTSSSIWYRGVFQVFLVLMQPCGTEVVKSPKKAVCAKPSITQKPGLGVRVGWEGCLDLGLFFCNSINYPVNHALTHAWPQGTEAFMSNFRYLRSIRTLYKYKNSSYSQIKSWYCDIMLTTFLTIGFRTGLPVSICNTPTALNMLRYLSIYCLTPQSQPGLVLLTAGPLSFSPNWGTHWEHLSRAAEPKSQEWGPLSAVQHLFREIRGFWLFSSKRTH